LFFFGLGAVGGGRGAGAEGVSNWLVQKNLVRKWQC
jgi:hypothetical protein